MAATLSLIVEDHGPANVHMILRVKDEDGILTITVLDNADLPLDFPDIPPCPMDTITVDLGAVARMRLPLSVTVTNCAEEAETTEFEDVGAPGLPTNVPGEPSIRLPCYATLCSDSAVCTNAKSVVRTVRNRLDRLCENRHRIERERTEKQAAIAIGIVVLGILYLAATAAALTPPFGWIAALVTLAVIAVLLYSMYRWYEQLTELSEQLLRINELIEEVRSEFDSAVDEVNNNCCDHCVDVDLSHPC